LVLVSLGYGAVPDANLVSYNFAGTINNNWGWNFPNGTPPIGTQYSGTVVYDISVQGIPYPNSSSTYIYDNAIVSIKFTVGDYSLSGKGGRIYVYNDTGNGIIGFQSWAVLGSELSGNIEGYFLNALELYLRNTSGPMPGGFSLPKDLSFFYSTLSQSEAEYDVISVDYQNSRLVGSGPLSLLQPVKGIDFFVNSHRLSGQELDHVLFVATSVLPQLLGGSTERIRVASRASWWGLKEGTFSLPNPHAFSTCSRLKKDGKSKDYRLKPLEVCEVGRAWQVGLAAVQVPNFTEQEVLDAVQALWPGRPVATILAEAAQLAGFDPTQGTGAAIVGSTGVLRKSWLLRHPVVGLTLVEHNVTAECIEGALSWCYATGYSKPWSQIVIYAPTRAGALQSVSDLAAIFGTFLP